MNWTEFSDHMDQYVIKRDGTAVDNEYFMATHVPFRELKFVESGNIKAIDDDGNIIDFAGLPELTEEKIYDKYIVNRSNRHQMIIVRGSNGTGKSHLICWLYNRFINDDENYNQEKEKVIFLRRLGNTVRGAIRQILDEGLVQDHQLKEKFEKFCNADKSQSEEEFKTSIYSEYVNKLATDSSDKGYKKIERKKIVAFLHDSRVQDYMMRPQGPIDRCYNLITAGTKTTVTENTDRIFEEEDFDLPHDLGNNIEREIRRNAAEEVRGYYFDDLKPYVKAKTKLVEYLNHLTSGVMQSCANISSENARDLFVNLRKSLNHEGKNLTIFIEDFTSFSIMESELITALAVENGGEYSDLCRVTSVIGITDGYYGSFKDNFKDRVTKQIIVTEQSFSNDEFLLELAARYLNAIYSTPKQIAEWYKENRENGSLPDPAYIPSIKWDYVELNGKKYTLYPFNKKSLITLYRGLKLEDKDLRSPRNYLTKVIEPLFVQFANDMEYGNNQTFPEVSKEISCEKLQSPYADNIENSGLSDVDKQRLKILFKIWGDESTNESNGLIGGIPAEFLKQIGLAGFKGSVSSEDKSELQTPESPQTVDKNKPADSKPLDDKPLLEKDKRFRERKEDIESWFDDNKTLEYSSNFNKWVRDFVIQSIDWQDEGLPGYFVKQRTTGSFVYIEDSKQDTKNKAVVTLERNSESRTVLMGLNLFDYYRNWKFDHAPYYQMVMINWIEHSKQTIINNIFGDSIGTKEHPFITWCIAAEYIQRLLNGESLERLAPEKLLQRIFVEFSCNQSYRTNKDWTDVLTYINNHKAVRESIHTALTDGSNTLMGVIGDTPSRNVNFYRTAELFNSLEHLKKAHWNISGELQNYSNKSFEDIRTYLKYLYTKVQTVTASEKVLCEKTIEIFEEFIGQDPSEQDYINAVNEIFEFFSQCDSAREQYSNELLEKFKLKTPQNQARTAIALYKTLKKAVQNNDSMELLLAFSKAPREKLDEINSNLSAVENYAKKVQVRRSKILGSVQDIDPLIFQGALGKLEQLSDTIEKMETDE